MTIGGSQRGSETITVNDIRYQASQLEATGEALDVLLNQTAPNCETSMSCNTQMNTTVNVPDFGKICDTSDPRMILTVKSSNKKAIHLTQFLTEVTRKKRQGRQRDLVLSKSADDSLVLRQDEDHPYSGITISE